MIQVCFLYSCDLIQTQVFASLFFLSSDQSSGGTRETLKRVEMFPATIINGNQTVCWSDGPRERKPWFRILKRGS